LSETANEQTFIGRNFASLLAVSFHFAGKRVVFVKTGLPEEKANKSYDNYQTAKSSNF